MESCPIEYRFNPNNEKYKEIKFLMDNFHCIIAGGAARQIFNNKDFGSTDIDLCYLSSEAKRATERFLNKKAEKININTYAKTYKYKEMIIQSTDYKRYDNIYSIIEAFDFTVCQFAIENNNIYYTIEAYTDEENNKLVLGGIDTLKVYRLVKYLNKGYIPNKDIKEKFIYFLKLRLKGQLDYMLSKEDTGNFILNDIFWREQRPLW